MMRQINMDLSVFDVDVVVVCTHSQGCVVSARVVERLLQMRVIGKDRQCLNGRVNKSVQKVGMLCMASIAHGPFAHLKSNIVVQYVEKDAARELFDYCDSTSLASKRFVRNMRYTLTNCNHQKVIV